MELQFYDERMLQAVGIALGPRISELEVEVGLRHCFS
jgi:hypothetical protein